MLIEAKRLRKSYQMGLLTLEVLKGIDLQVDAGEFVSIMGPSGSGKSTFMHILGCLDRPTQGDYYIDGAKVDQLDDKALSRTRNQKIGFVFQAFNLLNDLNVLHNVELPLVYAGIPHNERREKSLEVIESVGLSDRIHHLPTELSGGQCQRVAIARALVNDPAIILADEPTGNLDTKTGDEIIQIFQDINEAGRTIILVTHEEYVAQHTRRIVWIRDGVILSDELVDPSATRNTT